MRRPAHGGTSRPGPARPGNGYGRPLRVRPSPALDDPVDPSFWLERELELELERTVLREQDDRDRAKPADQQLQGRDPHRAPDRA